MLEIMRSKGSRMYRKFLLATALLLPISAMAQPVQYQSADNINNIPVSVANPMPVVGATPNGSSSTAITPVVSAGAATLLGKASAGNLYNVYMTNNSGAVAYLYVFNSSATPATGAVTAGVASGNYQDCIGVSNATTGSINFNPGPTERFANGIYFAASSAACGTNTAVSTGIVIHGLVQ